MNFRRLSFVMSLQLVLAGALDAFTTGLPITTSSSSPTMQTSFDGSATQFVRFQNLVPASPFVVTLDGQGNWLRFSNTGAAQMILDQNVKLTCQNLSLFGYAQSKVNFGSLATIAFGTGSRLYLQDNYIIGVADTPLSFSGNTIIDGMGGKVLRVDANAKLVVSAGATLTLRNIDLLTTAVSPFSLTATSTVVFQNCSLTLSSVGMQMSTGHFVWSGDCKVDGQHELDQNFTTSLTFDSPGIMSIESWASVEISKGINFVYQANPSGDTNLYQTKRHIKFADSSATLFLNGAGLVSTTTAIALDKGRLIIGDKVTLTANTAAGRSCEIGTSLKMEILAGAVLELAGPVNYITT